MEFGTVPPKRLPKQDMDVLALQMDQWTRARVGQQGWAEQAKECVDFVEGRQYSRADLAALEAAKIPALKLNKIGRLVRLMRGFFRQNRYDIRFLAGADGTGSDEVADVLTALSKHIDTDNRTKWLDAEVFDDGIVTGRGYIDMRLDFSRNALGEVRERVLDPFGTFPDPEGDTFDAETWNHVSLERWLSLDDIHILYGGVASSEIQALQDGALPVANMEIGAMAGDDLSPPRFFAGWDPFTQPLDAIQVGSMSLPIGDLINRHRRLVRVIETQHRKLKKVKRFIDTNSGQIRLVPDHWKDDRIQQVLAWAQGHQEQIIVDQAWVKAVRVTVTAANLILYDDWSAYRTFTVVPYFAQFRRGYTAGMVQDLIDPQKEINKRRSAILQVLMTAPNSGWKIQEDSLTEESKEALESHGGAPGLILEYKDGKTAPERIDVAGVPQGYVTAEGMANNDLNEIAGINEAALGQMDKVQSGRAVEARQRSAYVGAEQYFDNFARFQEAKGRKRLELIQDFYTEPRLFRVPNDAGTDQELLINWQQSSDEILNDVNSGSYHCTVDTAPVSATFMQGAFEEAKDLKTMGVFIPPDVMVDLSSIPFKKRIKDEQASQPPAPPPPQEINAQANLAKAQAAMPIAQLKAQTETAIADANNASEERIADKRVALETELEQAAIGSREALAKAKMNLELAGTVPHEIHPNAPGEDIPGQLQRNANTAFYSGNINASTNALQALDKMIGPIPDGTQTRASFQVLPHPAQE